MRQLNNLDLGSIKVHKQALAEIVASAVASIEGVTLVQDNIASKFLKAFEYKMYPGVDVNIDENGDVSLDVKVIVRFGLNIPHVATEIQDTVKFAIEKMVDIKLKGINVSIHGIERGVQ